MTIGKAIQVPIFQGNVNLIPNSDVRDIKLNDLVGSSFVPDTDCVDVMKFNAHSNGLLKTTIHYCDGRKDDINFSCTGETFGSCKKS